MIPMAIIQQAASDGVNLTLTLAGTIKATGEDVTLARWLPIIREHKPSILLALHQAANCAGITLADERSIRAWLTHIGEIYTDIIAEVLDKCQNNP